MRFKHQIFTLGIFALAACAFGAKFNAQKTVSPLEVPKVSVIIPVYKAEKYLDKCLDSVVNQTLKDIEIICVDDGSPDKCPQILDERAKKDKRIKVIHQKNGGITSARQTGLNVARGEYIKYIDDDDIANINMCKICYEKAIDSGADIFYHGHDVFTEKSRWFPSQLKNKTVVNQQFELESIYVWTALYRTEFLRKNNISWDGLLGVSEDICFNMMCVPKAKKIQTIPDILYSHRRDNKNSACNVVQEKEKARRAINNLAVVQKNWDKNEYFKSDKVKLTFLKWALALYDPQHAGRDYVLNKNYLESLGTKALDKKTISALPKKLKQRLEKIQKNAKRPKVSVVVPVYKDEKYIDECIKSLINQTEKNIEIILVDDGSPDKCPQILDNYAKKDNRIKVIHKENGGIAQARETGLKASTGEFVKFVDDDDILLPKACEICYNKAKKSGADILYHGHYKFNQKSRWNEKRPKNEIITKQQFKNVDIFVWAALYKRSFLEKYNLSFKDLKDRAEDKCFNMMCVAQAKKIQTISDVLYSHRDNVTSASYIFKGRAVILKGIYNVGVVRKYWESYNFLKTKEAKREFLKWALRYGTDDKEICQKIAESIGEKLLNDKTIVYMTPAQEKTLNQIRRSVKK